LQKIRRFTLKFDAPVTLNLPAGSIVRLTSMDQQDVPGIDIQLEAGSRQREQRTFSIFGRETPLPAGAVYCGPLIRWGGVTVLFVFELTGP
jgi:hypothetical protein